MITPQFYTVEEFANILRIQPLTVRKAIAKGNIQAFKPVPGAHSSRWRIAHTELDRLQEMSEKDRIKAAKEYKQKQGE